MKRKLGVAAFAVVLIFIVGWKQNPVPKSTMDRGKKVYDLYCLSCHMDNAMGVPRLNPPLVKSPLVMKTKTKPIRIVLRGSDELESEQERDYKNTMMPLSNLTDQQISDVLTFIRNSFGNKGSVITVGDVKYVRARTK